MLEREKTTNKENLNGVKTKRKATHKDRLRYARLYQIQFKCASQTFKPFGWGGFCHKKDKQKKDKQNLKTIVIDSKTSV